MHHPAFLNSQIKDKLIANNNYNFQITHLAVYITPPRIFGYDQIRDNEGYYPNTYLVIIYSLGNFFWTFY